MGSYPKENLIGARSNNTIAVTYQLLHMALYVSDENLQGLASDEDLTEPFLVACSCYPSSCLSPLILSESSMHTNHLKRNS
jgi:hypothetical protein